MGFSTRALVARAGKAGILGGRFEWFHDRGGGKIRRGRALHRRPGNGGCDLLAADRRDRFGVALLFEGGMVASRYWRLPEEVVAGRWASMELTGGMIAEFLAGVAGVVLGILALLGFASLLLTTIAGLVFGARARGGQWIALPAELPGGGQGEP